MPRMSSIPLRHAWVDESAHVPTPAHTAGVYLLAATIADPAECDSVRAELRELLFGKATRLHWREETPARQRQIACVVGQIAVTHTVVIGSPLNPRRPERARRKCMERLMHELTTLGVSTVYVETRTRRDNARDRLMLDVLRTSHAVTSNLRINFAQPDSEPMLWLPDVVAGAVGAHHRGGDSRPRNLLATRITEHHITLT